MPQPYKVFTIYAREDAQYLEELRGQLRPLEIAGRIKVWSDREINPGVDWENEIVHNLDTADIILILVSAAYYNSVYIHEKEIKYALTRHENGETKVLPIIVRPCSFGDDPVISRLQVLPTDGKPVTDKRFWAERDDAWLDVVTGLKRTLHLLDDAEKSRTQAALAAQQAEADARDHADRDRHEAEQRKRNEQAQRERDAERQRQQEAQRAENERLTAETQRAKAMEAQARREQEAERQRIKALKKQNAAPVPWGRYAAIGGGAALLLLGLWLVPKFLGGGEAQLPENSQLLGNSTQDTTASPLENQKKDLEKMTENMGSQPPRTDKPPGTTFDYPMVYVEGGTFQMGSPASEAGRFEFECQHPVSVGSFSIGKYEVTQAQWKAVMGNNPSKIRKNTCDDCPVENVSWHEVQSFIKKVNAETGKKYRLPKEAEWEYAAKGGKKSRKYAYSGSSDVKSVAWYFASGTNPVGKKLPNELGIYDMSGNVFEWCQDFSRPYPNCKEVVRGDYPAIRGGAWFNSPEICRTSYRSLEKPTGKDNHLGFRLAHDVGQG